MLQCYNAMNYYKNNIWIIAGWILCDYTWLWLCSSENIIDPRWNWQEMGTERTDANIHPFKLIFPQPNVGLSYCRVPRHTGVFSLSLYCRSPSLYSVLTQKRTWYSHVQKRDTTHFLFLSLFIYQHIVQCTVRTAASQHWLDCRSNMILTTNTF